MPLTPKDWKDFPDTSTPIEATSIEDIESRLGAYADAIGTTAAAQATTAQTNAEAYADAQHTDALAYTDDAVANIIVDAQTYADNVLADAEAYTDSHIATATTTIEAYADSRDTTTLNSAKSYADTRDTVTLNSAKAYSDTGDTTTLNSGKAYTDTQVAAVTGTFESVKKHGAVGDGTTNDYAAIQATIDLMATNGGVVFFPPGTYALSQPIVIKSKVHLKGSGNAATVIKLKNTINNDVIVGNAYGTGGIVDASISDLTIDGNKANNLVSGNGMIIDAQRFALNHVLIKNCRTDGAHFQETADDSVTFPAGGMENIYTDVRVVGCGRYGFYNSCHDAQLNMIHAIQNDDTNIFMDTVGLLMNCHAWNGNTTNPSNYGFRLGDVCQAVNCTAEGASTAQVLMTGQVNKWISGEVFDGSGIPNVPGFEFASGSNNHQIVGVYVHDTGTAGAFKFSGGGSGSYIQGNIYDPGGGPAAVGTVPADVKLDVQLGGSTTLGTMPGFETSRYGMTFPNARSAGATQNNTLYRDSADNKLKFKDNTGTVHQFYA